MELKDMEIKDIRANNEFLDLIGRANMYVESYYNYEIDLETLHSKLYRLFGNYKQAVEWFYNRMERGV